MTPQRPGSASSRRAVSPCGRHSPLVGCGLTARQVEVPASVPR
ncbi:hypothetical protein STVIR_5594 [Streptomyces viridochromogenes Tue57]|uniref:Uncharacterized protein n=1 Tax=Streptomyces viridochromogenes Tue57 TaxID=1160705 RepID=L8PAD6_STRVR|nr:hypothetical protein STVIR_5594 [Streptomyces viridochromogenes Tue57]